MRKLSFLLSTVLVAAMALPAWAGNDHRCTRPLDQTIAGSHMRGLATFKPVPPGQPETELESGTLIVLISEGKPGRGIIRGLARQPDLSMGPPPPPGPECAGFDAESHVPASTLIETFFRGNDRRNDQLYLRQEDSGDDFVCVSFVNPLVKTHITGDIVGGTGRFEGATGDFTVDVEQIPVSPDQVFSALTGTLTGTINLAKPGCP